MDLLELSVCNDVFNERDNIDIELVDSEAVDATINIMGLPGGSIMEGAFFVYKFL